MNYRQLTDRLTQVFRDEPSVSALLLAGSRGRGTSDAHSDVDVVACVADGHGARLCEHMPTMIAAATDTVHAQRLRGTSVFTYITPEWLRFDVSVIEASELVTHPAAAVNVLFDKHEVTSALSDHTAAAAPIDPVAMEALTREFLRTLGLLPVVIARDELVVGISGFGQLQQMLVRLHRLAARRVPGGALSFRHLIAPADHRRLECMPAVEATVDSIVIAHHDCARLFIPLARRLHEEVGAQWPYDMIEALEQHLCITADESFAGLATWK